MIVIRPEERMRKHCLRSWRLGARKNRERLGTVPRNGRHPEPKGRMGVSISDPAYKVIGARSR